MPTKPRFPFMVFRESLRRLDGTDDAARLGDPATTPDERATILRRLGSDVDVVRETAERDSQRGRHLESRRRRARVMADLEPDARGRPKRGEPKRLAKLHGVSVAQVRKWIEQLRDAPPEPAGARIPLDWRTVYHGRQLRSWYRQSARGAKKPKR